MTLMQESAAVLGSYMQTAAGREVRFRRGIVYSETIVGWQHQLAYSERANSELATARSQDGSNISTTVQSDVWTFATEELLLESEPFTPRPGDLIYETLNGVEVIYEVLPTPDGPAAVPFDTSGVLTLVYCKRISP